MLEIKRLENEVKRLETKVTQTIVRALVENLNYAQARERAYRKEYQAEVREATQRKLLNMQTERDAWKADMTEAVQSMPDLREERHDYKAALNNIVDQNFDLRNERDGLKVELNEAAQSIFDIQNERDGLKTELAAMKEIERQRSEKPDATKNQQRDNRIVQVHEVLQSCKHFNLEESITKQQSDRVLHVSPAAHNLCTENQLKAIGAVVQLLTSRALGSASKPVQEPVT
jgi:PAS domain-containing protein